MAEWLKRQTHNLLPEGDAGSNPVACSTNVPFVIKSFFDSVNTKLNLMKIPCANLEKANKRPYYWYLQYKYKYKSAICKKLLLARTKQSKHFAPIS